MTAAQEYSNRHYEKNRLRYLERAKQWRLDNRERSRQNNRESKKRSNRVKSEHEIQCERASKAKYRAKIKSLPKKELTEEAREVSRLRNREYRARLKAKNPKITERVVVKSVSVRKPLTEEQKAAIKLRQSRWRKENRGILNEKRKIKIRENPSFRVAVNYRSRLAGLVAMGIAEKKHRSFSLLGCDLNFFMGYLESLFLDGMTWGNYGKGGWELDHVIPVASFDLTDSEQQHACFRYTNIQPLWAKTNRQKGKKLNHSTKTT